MVMTGKQLVRNVFMGLLVGAYLCFGQPDSSARDSQSPAQPQLEVAAPTGQSSPFRSVMSMFFALDEGQVMQGADGTGGYKEYDRLWQQRLFAHFTDDITYMERLRLILSIECMLTFSMKQYNTLPQTLTPLWTFYPNDAELRYTFGNLSRPWLQISAGYFPFKYNPDAKDLGEYLIRDGAYPTYLVSNFEFAETRELGLHLNGNVGNPAIDQMRWDLMLTSETHFWPLQDWTVSGLISNNLFNFFDAGIGASWQRAISVDESKTTPHNNNNIYYDQDGNLQYYTYRALKLMGRASLNPQRFIPEFRIPFAPVFGDKPFFGKEDLKVYGEIAALGWFNYNSYQYDSVLVDTAGGLPGHNVWTYEGPKTKALNYYDSLLNRTPFMVGIDLPTNPIISYSILPFILTKWLRDETGTDIRALSWVTLVPGLAAGALQHFTGCDIGLDELSLEFEWADQEYTNDNGNAINPDPTKASPIPHDELTREQALSANHLGTPQQVKYALYFKKTFMNQKFALSGLVARDHMRPPVHGDATKTINDDFLITASMWWWTIRLSANF
jgi:hypothetical protein